MTVSLNPVTRENYEEVCNLQVEKEQEDYVADNIWSLVESMFNPTYQTRAIYNNNTPVGFLMWVPMKPDEVSIWRFMVDKKYQKRGIGRKALQLAIEEIKQTEGLKRIGIYYNPHNPVAKKFYSSLGFVEIGREENGDEDDGDLLAVIKLEWNS